MPISTPSHSLFANTLHRFDPGPPPSDDGEERLDVWGFKDTQFLINGAGNVVLDCKRYLLSGQELPAMLPWVCSVFQADINAHDTNPSHYPTEISASRASEDVLRAMRSVVGDNLTIDAEQRLRRGHGQTQAEMYAIKYGRMERVPGLAAESRARLVLVSTSGTVGCFSSPDVKADEGAPYCADAIRRWPYYDSKMRAEIEARRLADQLSVELVIVRLPVLLGPGDHRQRSTSLVHRLATGRQSFVMAGGIAFSDVRDVARGLAAVVSCLAPQRIYHFAGTSCSLAEFFRRCAALAGKRSPRLRLPKAVALPLAHLADGVAHIVGRISPLPDPVVVEMASQYWGFTSRWSHELGYLARPAEETLRDTIEWLQPKEGASL